MSTAETLTKASRAVVEHWLDALKRGDVGSMNALYSDDIVMKFPGDARIVPWAGEWTGMARVLEAFEIIGRTLDIRSHVFRHVLADGEHVVVIGDEISASKTTQRVFGQTYAWLFTVRGGRIVRYELFEDTETISAAYR